MYRDVGSLAMVMPQNRGSDNDLRSMPGNPASLAQKPAGLASLGGMGGMKSTGGMESMLQPRMTMDMPRNSGPSYTGYKKGGKVAAKPKPKRKSKTASSRGDGIASKGKTKGRMY